MGNAQFKPVTIDAAHFKDIQIQIGNNIMPNIGLQVAESSPPMARPSGMTSTSPPFRIS